MSHPWTGVARMARLGVRSGSVVFARWDDDPANKRFERTDSNGRERSPAFAMQKVVGSSPVAPVLIPSSVAPCPARDVRHQSAADLRNAPVVRRGRWASHSDARASNRRLPSVAVNRSNPPVSSSQHSSHPRCVRTSHARVRNSGESERLDVTPLPANPRSRAF